VTPGAWWKLVTDADGVLLGVHLAGPWATELLGEGYLSVNWRPTPPTSPRSSTPTRRSARCSAKLARHALAAGPLLTTRPTDDLAPHPEGTQWT
jgi:hypothetical protein